MSFNLSRGLSLSLKEFCSSTPLCGYHFFGENQDTKQKCFWAILQVLVIISTVFFVVQLWFIFMENPIYSTLTHGTYLVTKIPFPAISICNTNKLSKRRVEEVVDYLANYTRKDPAEWENLIKILGTLYEFDSNNKFENVEYFENILKSVPRNDFKLQNIVKYLTTPCEELLVNCRWKGEEVNCSAIFTMGLVYDGYCCIFNYVDNIGENRSIIKQRGEVLYGEPGFDKGLDITIEVDRNDYFYTSLSSVGVKIAIFAPEDYPDVFSGSFTEHLFGVSTQGFLEITPITYQSNKNVMKYPISLRNCLFESERSTYFGFYSQSNCLVACRVKSIRALCDCVPFMIPKEYDSDEVCTLADNECLGRYKSKWTSLKPYDANLDAVWFPREMHNSLQCDKPCYPECERTFYGVSSSSSAIQNEQLGNTTNVRIFYSKRFYNLFKQDVTFYWFEILSYFGSTFSFFLGFSLISAFEFLFFIICRTITHAKRNHLY